jgi:hypothetical protein
MRLKKKPCGYQFPLLAQNGPTAMSAARSLSRAKRTWLGEPCLVEIDPKRTSPSLPNTWKKPRNLTLNSTYYVVQPPSFGRWNHLYCAQVHRSYGGSYGEAPQ